ncbi:MAG: response regulator transcription factor [Chitinophagaceae bacterium]|nr:response regulator transcription factor [Chitinophagaceae bacterium]
MLRAIIVDDEKLSRNTLKKLLELYCPAVSVVGESESADQATKLLEQVKPDLVFLDVAMPGKNGIDFLKGYGEINFEVIFVTAHDKYILQAIRFAAVDYLQKPVDEQQLVNAVANASKRIMQKTASQQVQSFLHNMQTMNNPQDLQLCIPTVKGFQVVTLSDILYCEAENTYTNIFFKDGKKVLASRPLMDYELMLQDSQFFRIHKSTLVNLKHIREYQKGEGGFVVMSNGRELEVSRRKKEMFIARMKETFKY